VGAGPAGLLLGILLAKQGINITILEANTELDKNPRAAHYASIAIQEMRRAGILEDVRKEGYIPEGVCWREFDGTYIAGIKSHVDDPDVMICLPLDKLIRLYYRHFQKEKTGELLWAYKVVGIEQDVKEARVICETPEGTKILGADYVLGCDGANSQVRRSLFGKEYPGETLHSQIIATNVSCVLSAILDFEGGQLTGDCRFIMTSTSSATGTRTLSSIQKIGIWQRKSRPMACGA
jgi:2-polyprenyl-6-methoxyphenol hydroxylase-like FAD-dependent oxidoreductase